MSLSDETQAQLIAYAMTLRGTPHDRMDCSHFVYCVYKHLFPTFDYMPSESYLDSPLFRHVALAETKPGDLILWAGHIAILVNPAAGSFIGSQTSTGVAVATMSNPYWHGRRVLALLTVA